MTRSTSRDTPADAADADDGAGAARRVIVVPVEGFSLISLAAVIDPLRAADRILGRKAYCWSIATLDGEAATASVGLPVPAHSSLADAPIADLVLVCAGLVTEPPGEAALVTELRRRARRGEAIGAVSSGACILGRAGLLDGYRCTVHWEHGAAFAQANPNAELTGATYEIDRSRYTSGGGTASIDMMLEMIGHDHSQSVARGVANQFQHERIRSSADRQRPANEPDLTGKPDVVARLIRTMADNLEEPLPAQALADTVGLSVRQIERLFVRYVKATPTNYYIGLRLARARELLRQTNASVLDVALATGFTSQSHFAQSYRATFGNNPSDERK